MIFDFEYGYYVKASEEEGITGFCTDLVIEASSQKKQVMGKFDEVYLIASPDSDVTTLVEQYKKELDRIAHHNYKKNGEGYTDMTAYDGITNAESKPYFHRVSEADRERHKKVLGCIFRLCELADFSIEDRIILKDKRTGKVWR